MFCPSSDVFEFVLNLGKLLLKIFTYLASCILIVLYLLTFLARHKAKSLS